MSLIEHTWRDVYVVLFARGLVSRYSRPGEVTKPNLREQFRPTGWDINHNESAQHDRRDLQIVAYVFVFNSGGARKLTWANL